MSISVALIRQRYTPDGGAERFVSRALDALGKESLQVTLVAREWAGDAHYSAVRCNPFYLGRLWRDWSFALGVCRFLKTSHFDLVQSHERLPCCDIYRAGDGVHREWLRQLSRVRGPVGRLGLAINPYHRYVLWAERRLFASPQLKAVICNSDMVKQEIRRNFGVPQERLHVIYNGVDIEVFHPSLKKYRAEIRRQHAVPADAPLFLFVGSGFERKGLCFLLEAMARLPPDAHLLVVGRDKRIRQYQKQIEELGLSARVRLLGSQADVRPFYGAADTLVLPTLYDPFPNVVVEALASGLPVVTSNTCGAAELLGNDRGGYVCEATDVSALASNMARLLSPSAREPMSHAARATGEQFNIRLMTTNLVRLYERLTFAATHT